MLSKGKEIPILVIIFASVFCKYSLAQFRFRISKHFQDSSQVFLEPRDIVDTLSVGSSTSVEWYTTYPEAHYVSYSVAEPIVSKIIDEEILPLENLEGNITGRGRFSTTSDLPGFNLINVTIYDGNNNTLGIGQFEMWVNFDQELNWILTIILGIFVFKMYICMGASIDLTIVWSIAKKPIGPIVGIICQCLIMPVIAFGLSVLFFRDNKLMQFGFFIYGVSSGGGQSNVWTLLLGGSLDMSIVMTFVSIIVAFGAFPLWALTFGPQIIGDNSDIKIPYVNIAFLVVILGIPCAIGLAIQLCCPKVASFLKRRVLTIFAFFHPIFMFLVGGYSRSYVFRILTWKIILASIAFLCCGYCSGVLLAILFRRKWPAIIAISMETGAKNANIALLILKVTLGSPAGDLATVPIVCIYMMTPILLFIALVIKKCYGCFSHSGGKDITILPNEGLENGITNTTVLPDENNRGAPQQMDIANRTAKQNPDLANRKSESTLPASENLSGIENPAVDYSNEPSTLSPPWISENTGVAARIRTRAF